MARPVRIANFSGYMGDRFTGLDEVMAGDSVDVLVGDYLAEISLAPLSAAYRRHPDRGFVEYFRAQLRPHLAAVAGRGLKVVANAGGFNPAGLAEALRVDVRDAGLALTVAHVRGDDVLPRLPDLQRRGHRLVNLDTGADLTTWQRQAAVANAYLGGWGIAAALSHGADIVICGRVTDASLVVGPAAWWHGWGLEEWDALAGAVVAGHIIECGPQAVGGNHSGFAAMSDQGRLTRPGFPIAEIDEDGSCIIGRHTGQGGHVTRDTITAQLLYEIQGPRYLNPDVTVHLEHVELHEAGADRIRVSGASGTPPPPTTKVALFAVGGWQTAQTVFVTAPDVEQKLALLLAQLSDGKPDDVSLTVTQVGSPDPHATDQWGATVAVRVLATAELAEHLDTYALAARISGLYLSSFPGYYTDIATPMRESRRERVEYWPGLLDQSELEHQVVLDDGTIVEIKAPVLTEIPANPPAEHPDSACSTEPTARRPLGTVAHTRSGDKGGNSSVGIWTTDEQAWPWLRATLTVDLVRTLLPETVGLDIVRHELPHLRAVHLIFKGLLGTGGSSNTRLDQVGKAVGEYLRSREVDIPVRLLKTLDRTGRR